MVPAWTSSATRSKTLPTPGQVAVGQQLLRPVGAQVGDAQLEALVVGGDHDAHVAVAGVHRRVGGDGVGEQDGVVEAVDRALGAGGEHPDHAAEHRGHERAAADADDGLVGGGAAGHAITPSSLTGAPRSKVIRTSVSSESPGAELERLGQRGDERQAEPEPRAVGPRHDAAARGR